MGRVVSAVLIAALLAGAGLWAADAASPGTKEAEVTSPPEKILPMGALVFAIRPAGAQVLVNRLATPPMSVWMVGQELMTGADQFAHLLLADRTVMTLGPKSNAVLQQEPVLTSGSNKTRVQLRRGSIQATVSQVAVVNSFGVTTPVGDAMAITVNSNFNVEVSSSEGMDHALVRVKAGQVDFRMNDQSYPVKEGEKRLFSQPSRADNPLAMTTIDMDALLDLMAEQAAAIKDEELKSLLAQTVTVNVRVKSGRVMFRVNELEYGIEEGQKRTILQPSRALDPEVLTEQDFEVMLDLLEKLARKLKDQDVNCAATPNVMATGATLFAVRPEGSQIQVADTHISPSGIWNVGLEMRTNAKQYAHLILSDRTVMTLGPESSAVLQQTPLANGANATTVHLRKGSIQVSTSKIATQNGFRVGTPLGDAIANGTDYHVEIKMQKDLPPRVVPVTTSNRGSGGRIVTPIPLSP